jgi:CheY-like chemotaxis protein
MIGRGAKPLVLIVEDSENTQELLSDFLEAQGFAVIGASTGDEALDSAVRHRPDVVVMDYDLPGKNGCQVTRHLKADPRTCQAPVLLVTGFVQTPFMEQARRAGCDAFIGKPFTLDQIVGEIRQLLLGIERTMPKSIGRILLVEDDDDVRHSLRDALRDEGYQTVEATNGVEALAYLRSGCPRPDVILLDLMLPQMDGWQFRAIQRRDRALSTIPVVVLTALPAAKQMAESLEARQCLQKPVSLSHLIEALDHAAHG